MTNQFLFMAIPAVARRQGSGHIRRTGRGHVDQIDTVTTDAQPLGDELGDLARLAFGVGVGNEDWLHARIVAPKATMGFEARQCSAGAWVSE
jgi:hypothetical protein